MRIRLRINVRDLAGQQLAEGFRGVFSELRGDWKWQKEALGLENFYGANYVCHLCKAHKKITRLLYTNFGRNAFHRRTRHSWRKFKNWSSAQGIMQCPFFTIPGFHIWRCLIDALHCIDLGVLQHAIASALVELVDEGVWPGASEQEKFFAAHADYSAWCRARGEQPAPRFNHKKFSPENDYACMTQNIAKGAQTRVMQHWILEVCMRPGVRDDPHGEMRLCLFLNLCRADDIMKANDRFISAPDLEELQKVVESALLCYNALAVEAYNDAYWLWHVVPKFHMLEHSIYDQAAQANPRTTSCYCDEDMVGKMKRLLSRCHGATAGTMGIHRYVILVGVRWWARLAQLRNQVL